MSLHTPGPWKFSQWTGYGDTRFYISQADGAPYTPNYSDVATVIAETCIGERVKIQEANARLIALAPEMLDTLRHIAEYWNRDRNDMAMHDACWFAIHTAEEIISRATGAQK